MLVRGAVLGLAGGLAPGPLTALVMSETLRHGAPAGVRVACAPLISDGPVMLVSFTFAGSLAAAGPALGLVSLVGALFLVWLGYDTARATGWDAAEAAARFAASGTPKMATPWIDRFRYMYLAKGRRGSGSLWLP